ncbi:hypothetical protein AADZ90_005695 [Aestuariibius sp. 2305UL40-4]|uniref:hypothetical protein n=1 Tax=Aestuariibius violaceus TaxID=3234132 RepID=UPI00345EA351
MGRIKLAEAAALVDASYSIGRCDILKDRLARDPLDHWDVQAVLIDDGTLLIPGSNHYRDYIKFNLGHFRFGDGKYRMSDLARQQDGSGALWHRGFFAHAKVIHDWLGDRPPKRIIGHSLGAASAQILSQKWKVPTLCFASPRPHYGHHPLVDERWTMNICRDGDPVIGFPGKFRHVGAVTMLKSGMRGFALRHAMPHYRRLLLEHAANPKLPVHWPKGEGNLTGAGAKAA